MKIPVEITFGLGIIIISTIILIYWNFFLGILFVLIGLLYFTGFFKEELKSSEDESSAKKKKKKRKKYESVLTFSDGIVTRYESKPRIKSKNIYKLTKKGKDLSKYKKT